ncbi:MAG: hypothetical protein HYU66_15585 [Armatimonadetes bacterium]|nr:hypothetical protein [Armatimonadota bacterium]
MLVDLGAGVRWEVHYIRGSIWLGVVLRPDGRQLRWRLPTGTAGSYEQRLRADAAATFAQLLRLPAVDVRFVAIRRGTHGSPTVRVAIDGQHRHVAAEYDLLFDAGTGSLLSFQAVVG